MEELEITRLGAQGDGISACGRYVAGALPGERVLVEPKGDRARLVKVLRPGPDRVTPECPHVEACGGCALQHAADPFLAGWKRDLVGASLGARGIDGVEIRETLTSPPGSRRRITVAARRTRKGVTMGFHGAQSHEVVPISACLVAAPELIDVLNPLAELVPVGASRKGEMRFVLTLSEGGVDAAVFDAKELDGPARALLAGAANRAGVARLSWNGEEVVTRRPPVHRMGRARVVPPPGGFLQATAEGEAALVEAVRGIVGKAGRVVDLFAGSGTFALRLAETAEVLAVESEAAALAALDRAWRETTGLKAVRCERRDLIRRPLIPMELKGIEAVVIDPPRAGARLQAERLAASDVATVASVSCNPATFARDARILIDGGFRLDWVQPIDQFRWSSHVELVASFRR